MGGVAFQKKRRDNPGHRVGCCERPSDGASAIEQLAPLRRHRSIDPAQQENAHSKRRGKNRALSQGGHAAGQPAGRVRDEGSRFEAPERPDKRSETE